jgi:hypothetical protein
LEDHSSQDPPSWYYWPTLFPDVCREIRACIKCQKFSGKQQLKSLPLKPVVVSAPFQQWGLDFIGEIHPPSSGQHRWILTATDYFTKWIEAVPTRSTSHKVIISFLEDIIARFDCPSKIVTDNASPFRSEPLVKFCEQFGISLIHSTPYYPQGNGLAESSNKSLIKLIKSYWRTIKGPGTQSSNFLFGPIGDNQEILGSLTLPIGLWNRGRVPHSARLTCGESPPRL